MSVRSSKYLVMVMCLFLACRDAVDHGGVSKNPGNDESRRASEAGLPSQRVRLLQLDSKTSIPFADRDRTDQQYFHGFRILAETSATDAKARLAIDALLTDISKGVWNSDPVRDADCGVSVETANGTEDLLICSHCAPPTVARPGVELETAISAETSAAFKRIISSAFRSD